MTRPYVVHRISANYIVLLPNSLIIVSNRMNIDIVSRETLKNFLNSSLLSNFDTYFFTNLSNMFAAAGVIPGSNLASLMLLGLCFSSTSFTSFDKPCNFDNLHHRIFKA